MLNPAAAFSWGTRKDKSAQLALSMSKGKEGRHVGITEWVLGWLIVNALFVVWRILVTNAETRDQPTHKMPNVADL